MKKGTICFVLFIIVSFVSIGCSTAGKVAKNEDVLGKKYALVIGNTNYVNLPKLKNPVNDAEDISKLLEQYNFQVELCLDLNYAEMELKIDRFIENLSKQNNAEGLFYFAGQGLRINGNNCLMPVDIIVSNEEELVTGSYGMEALFSRLINANNSVNVVIADACFTDYSPIHRGIVFIGKANEPQSDEIGGDGLDIIEQFSKDVFYLQSALPGEIALDGIGRNSPFTQALLENLIKPVNFIELVEEIINDTVLYSNGNQQPYFKANIYNYGDYIIIH